MNIVAWSDASAEAFGDYEALAIGEKVWTGAALHAQAARLAGAFVKMGIAPGDRVVLLLASGPELVVAHAAVLRAGAVVVVLSPHSMPVEIDRVIGHCEAAAVITSLALRSKISDVDARIRHRIIVGAEVAPPAGWHELAELITAAGPLVTPVARAATDIARIMYTSGTTGVPKGVIATHGAFDVARLRDERMAGGRPDAIQRILVPLPLSQGFGGAILFQRLWAKVKIVLAEPFDPLTALKAIEAHRVEVVRLAPSMGEALLAALSSGHLARHDLSSLKTVFISGGPSAKRTLAELERVLGVRVINSYGLSELPGVGAWASPQSSADSVGQLLPGTEGRIVDETGAEVAQGGVGEIELRGAVPFAGYFDNPEATANAVRDGWFRTRDLGYRGANGDLYIVGRSKELVIQAGVKIVPAEVEQVIASLAGVRECAVLGVPNALLGEELIACVVRAPSAQLTASQVLDHCRAVLDRRKVPLGVRFVDALPKTELGKIQRHLLREQIVAERAAVAETPFARELREAPNARALERLRGEVRDHLARILGHALPDSATEQTFGNLGLDSLGAVGLATALAQRVGRVIAPTLTFNHPTIDAAAAFLLGEVVGRGGAAPREARKKVSRGAQPSQAIALVGMACRLPGGINAPEQLWALLRRGADATSDVERWDMDEHYHPQRGVPGKTYTRRAGLIEGVDRFDAEFFGFNAREARSIDPQHRFVLETSWEAIESAGYDPTRIADTLTGVFVGINGSSYGHRTSGQSMVAGRLSYFLGLDGPAVAIDTACSSSLVAIHTAAKSLLHGECDLAISGGVHLILSPEVLLEAAGLQILSADGHCRAFDARAEGTALGEGCVMVVMKRLEDAVAARDPILGVLRGSAVNQNGRGTNQTAPSGSAQQALLRSALHDAGVAPSEVDYLEAHGTGTHLGDPIEVEAAVAVLAQRERALVIGSVKSNVGHTIAAAGAVGLAKVLLALEHEEIPPTAHFEQLNPILAPLRERIEVPKVGIAWPRAPLRPRIAGITSMGLSGTNAHVLIEEPPVAPEPESPAGTRGHQLLTLSARNPAALADMVERYAGALSDSSRLVDVCYTAAVGRKHFTHRLAVTAANSAEARARLTTFATDGAAPGVVTGVAGKRGKLAFVFTGQGSQYVGMGRRLYETEPTFRRALDRCAEVLGPILPRPLLDVLHAAAPTSGLTLDDTALAQPALFALGWSLSELWRSWGIVPDVVLGHSLGEYTAATVAGLFSLEDGLRLAAERGRLMQSLPPGGAMMAFSTDEQRVRAAIVGHERSVSISGINGPSSVVLSGEREIVTLVSQRLAAAGIEGRALRVSHAFHSPQMDPILDSFLQLASAVRFQRPALELVSTLSGGLASFEQLSDPRYWCRQLREAVQFSGGMRSLAAHGCDTFVEIGPNPVLLEMGRRCVEEPERRAWLPSLRKGREDAEQMLGSLGALYAAGTNPDWEGVHRDQAARRVRLPTYAFQRKSYWEGEPLRDVEGPASTAPRPKSVPEAASRSAATRTRLLAQTPTERVAELTSLMRTPLAEVLDRPVDQVPLDANLLKEGLDSLRVMDFLAEVARTTGVVCTPGDFIATPTVAGFAHYVAGQLANEGGSAVAATTDAKAATPPPVSQLITINDRGSATPLFCIHPAGGQVTAYLRLRALLGDDQPLYAIQSRAAKTPDTEYATIQAMADDYAALISGVSANRACRLFGWSMGGLIAQAVASSLEGKGHKVELIAMVDPASGGIADWGSSAEAELALALKGVIFDLSPTFDGVEALNEALAKLNSAEAATTDLRIWCEERNFVPQGRISTEEFANRLSLRRRHQRLILEYVPEVAHHAPIAVWWASERKFDWARRTKAAVREHVVTANHFTVMRPPHIDGIIAGLMSLSQER